jgi:inositol-polyphosphate multikinase
MSTSGHAPLASQVGGHAGVLSSEDGSLIIKPSLPSEIAFYQLVSGDDAYENWRGIIPKFLGTLKLAGEVKPAPGGEGEVIKLAEEVAEKEVGCLLQLKSRLIIQL